MSDNKKHRKNGEGTLFKRKDGRWQASFVPENGKRLYFYGKTQAEALEKLRKAQQEEKRGSLATGPKQRLGDYLVYWLEEVYKPTVRVSTYLRRRTIIHMHLAPRLGHLFLQKLMPQHIQAFYTEKMKEGLKASTVALIHAVLHTALEHAVKWNLVARNVASLVSVPHSDPQEVRALTSDEARKLIEVARDHWLEPLLILALTTGLRRGELLALRWSDIDVSHGIMQVRRTANRYAGYGFVENDPKTKRSRRNIILSDIALQALQDQHVLQDKMKTKAGERWQEQDLVFTNRSGGFFDPETLVKHFHLLLDKAGLPHIRFHDLRHSAATILLTMGVHPKVVQEILGHSTIAMTMDTYSHLLPSMQKDAAGKMNDVFRLSRDAENS